MTRQFLVAGLLAGSIAFLTPLAARAAESPFALHPAAAALDRLFAPNPTQPKLAPANRKDYLKLIAGDVDFFKSCQAANGTIIDPYMKREFQYSTPAFALAAAVLATEAGRKDLLEPAVRALTISTDELATHKTADGHADFYIPLVMQTRRILKDKVPAATLATWDKNLRLLDPAASYNTGLRGMNWNIVNTSGELLRRKDGLVDDAKRDAQIAYLEESLAGQAKHLTQFGMYDDPSEPIAYDSFARLWLEMAISDGAYDTGKLSAKLHDFLKTGSLSTLLLLSPNGELACGGRSAFHQWNEAETAAICEMEAVEWKAAGQPDVAGAMKRAAQLAYQSMLRWQRPSGEMWIVKNRAEPDTKLGFETYSGHSQYNLLAAAMLAMAYERADDSITPTPTPAERGGYVFDLRDTFHKVIAAAGGYYIEIDTAGDPHYNATGLQRIMRTGVALSPLSDSTAAERAFNPTTGPKRAMAPGIEWQTTAGGPWLSLAAAKAADLKADLKITQQDSAHVSFTIAYSAGANQVTETYLLTADGVDLTTSLTGNTTATRALLPALTDDGKEPTTVKLDAATAKITLRGSTLGAQLLDPVAQKLTLAPEKIACHNGYMQPLQADLPKGAQSTKWHFTLEQTQK